MSRRARLHLVREQHGRGPVHYAADFGYGLLLEFYSANLAEQVTSRLRLGLAVPAAVAHRVGARTTLSDPDGRIVVATAVEPIRYFVTTRRWAQGWEPHVSDADGAEIGVTQVEHLDAVEWTVRDYIAACDLPPGQINSPDRPGHRILSRIRAPLLAPPARWPPIAVVVTTPTAFCRAMLTKI